MDAVFKVGKFGKLWAPNRVVKIADPGYAKMLSNFQNIMQNFQSNIEIVKKLRYFSEF